MRLQLACGPLSSQLYQPSEHGVWGHTALAEAEDAMVIPELNLTMTLVQIYEEAGVAFS